MHRDYPVFLPNVIATSTVSMNRLTDEGVRLSQARDALFRLIADRHFDRIVIVDGSNRSVLSNSEIAELSRSGVEIEQLMFQQNREQVQLFGKSNGEVQITEFMLANSALIREAGGFYKLTPRWTVENLGAILGQIRDLSNVFYHFHPPLIRRLRPFVITSFYKLSVSAYEQYFTGCLADCGPDVDGYLEAVFFRRIHTAKLKRLRVEFPHFSGIGGTLGLPISNRYYWARDAMSRAGLLACSF